MSSDIVTNYVDFHATARNFRDYYTSIAFLAIQSAVRIITCPTITRYAIRRRSITRVSPLIGISQDRKLVRARRKEKKALATARERAWVLARYDAIMRYGPRRRGGRGRGKRARKRETERIGRANKKKRNQTRWRRRRRREGRMVLPPWPWLGPKLRWVEVLPGPLVASPSLPLALPRFSLPCPAALRAHRRAPPGLPCSSAFADSSIKDITKSTLDENTLPLYRGVPRERRAKTLRLR